MLFSTRVIQSQTEISMFFAHHGGIKSVTICTTLIWQLNHCKCKLQVTYQVCSTGIFETG